MLGFKCQKCGLVNSIEQPVSAANCKRCNTLVFLGYDQANAKLYPTAILSTGDIPYKYEIVRLVFAYGNSTEAFLQGVRPVQAYEQVSGMLIQNALILGANAVIHIKFDYRVAVSHTPIININSQVFEVFGYGTAVKIVF